MSWKINHTFQSYFPHRFNIFSVCYEKYFNYNDQFRLHQKPLHEKISRFRLNEGFHKLFLVINLKIIYYLIAGIVLCALGILMLFGQPSFLLARYEWFQKLFRKNMIRADRKAISRFYSLLFFVPGLAHPALDWLNSFFEFQPEISPLFSPILFLMPLLRTSMEF